MAKEKIYFQSIQELENNSILKEQAEKEFVNEISTGEFLGNEENLEGNSTSRRDFLKFLGFSTAAATIAACETPVQHAIPYVVKPEEVIPGVANFYASSYYDGHEYASVLVKTREGRPINIQGNSDAPYGSGLSPRIQGSVLSLYDSSRLTGPQKGGAATDWKTAIGEVQAKLEQFAGTGEKVVFMTSTLISPSSKRLIAEFQAKYPNFQHVTYDAVSYSAMLDANEMSFGKRMMPSYRFDNADVIVSLGADFLQDWTELSHSSQYSKNRNADAGKMSRHYQFEANMSLTGSNADYRTAIKSSEQGMVAVGIYNELAKMAGVSTLSVNLNSASYGKIIKQVAKDLWNAKGKSLVVAGGNNVAVQMIVNGINELLSNYGSTIDLANASNLKQSNDAEVNALVKDMKGGNVAAILMLQVNPLYTLANAADFAAGLDKVKLSVSFSAKADETASKCQYILPNHHVFESWDDAAPVAGFYSLTQPTISPLFDTKQWQDVFLSWMGSSMDYYGYIQNNWKESILGLNSWNTALHDGYVTTSVEAAEFAFNADLNKYAQELKKASNAANGFELNLYTKSGIGTGVQANNPWLQELPDPITRATWDNYITMSAADAKENGLSNTMNSDGSLAGKMARVSVNGVSVDVPVYVQPGQASRTIGLALGYGRTMEGKAANDVGVNAYPFYKSFQMTQGGVTIEKIEGEHKFALVQVASTLMGRDKIVRESTLEEFKENPKVNNAPMTMLTHKGHQSMDKVTLWETHEKDVHFWNLSIDLTKCTGCAACVVACHAENNVPVVGKEEVSKSRDMH
jgi:molybdopterin-containing oxidoreductase family iron-sulfur binding subunit